MRNPLKLRQISIHALREEGDDEHIEMLVEARAFLSTPSARRATRYQLDRLNDEFISIHALREEGDHVINNAFFKMLKFLSTPSARRATSTKSTGLSA